MTTEAQMTEEQVNEFAATAAELKSRLPQIETLSSSVKSLQDESSQLKQHMTDVRRSLLTRHAPRAVRPAGSVSDDCARYLAAQFVAHCEKSGKLEALCSLPAQRDALTSMARETLNISTRAALTTTDIPLPTQYAGQIRELISEFGVVRRKMHPYAPRALRLPSPASPTLEASFCRVPP
jgi:hypothetical protein